MSETNCINENHCCPIHEPLTERQVSFRLNLAVLSGLLILSGMFLHYFGNGFSAEMSEILACVLLAGPILKDAYRGLSRGSIGFPSLVALAFLACIAKAEYTTAGLVAFFMLLADQLENRTAIGAGKAVENLIKETPNSVHREIGGQLHECLISDLKINDTIVVKPGEMIAIDGVVLEGESSVDESSMTGESFPVDKQENLEVFAGTTNLTGVLKIKVQRLGEDTTIGKVKSLILSASQTKLPVISIIERSANWYTPFIIMLAGLVYFFQREQANAFDISITLLIMACPCSLVLATPSVMIASITAAARAGILIKNVVELEFLNQIEHVFFDKTGTLTTGHLSLVKINCLQNVSNEKALKLAGALAQYSNHPSAKGILESTKKANIQILEAVNVSEVHGKGMFGNVDGRSVYLGRKEWLVEKLDIKQSVSEDEIHSTLFLGVEGEGLIAGFTFEDQLKEDAVQSISQLRECGVKAMSLLTGDSKDAADKVANELHLDYVHSKCLPQDKLEHLNKTKSKGEKTAVVGDGINDAPVLASGDVGIAMGALGSQVAIESASITLMGSSLNRLPYLFKLSKKTKFYIWINIFIGMLFLIFGILFSILGLLTPVIAAILHNVSAFIIIFNSARIVKFKCRNV